MRTYLGEFEQVLLYALVQLEGEAYGGRIRELIEARTGRRVSPGAIYTALDRMEQRGLVSSTLGEATAQRGGKRKRLFTITASGRRTLQELRTIRDRLWRAIEEGR